MQVAGRGFRTSGGSILVRLASSTSDALYVTEGVFVSGEEITFETPPHTAFLSTMSFEHFDLQLSLNNGGDFTDTGKAFTYTAEPRIDNVVPSSIAAIDGNVVVIVGKNFHIIDPSVLRCKFGTIVVPGTYISATEVRCPVPELLPGIVGVRISTNLVDYTPSEASLRVDTPTSLTSVYPSFGPKHGGTDVVVNGSSIPQDVPLRCKFGTNLAEATLIAKDTFVCTAPAIGIRTTLLCFRVPFLLKL